MQTLCVFSDVWYVVVPLLGEARLPLVWAAPARARPTAGKRNMTLPRNKTVKRKTPACTVHITNVM